MNPTPSSIQPQSHSQPQPQSQPQLQSQSSSTSSSAVPVPAPVAVATLNSDLIQQYLDENQLMLAAILEHQNAGRMESAVKYQQKLQQNLMYLATLADQSRATSNTQKHQ